MLSFIIERVTNFY